MDESQVKDLGSYNCPTNNRNHKKKTAGNGQLKHGTLQLSRMLQTITVSFKKKPNYYCVIRKKKTALICTTLYYVEKSYFHVKSNHHSQPNLLPDYYVCPRASDHHIKSNNVARSIFAIEQTDHLQAPGRLQHVCPPLKCPPTSWLSSIVTG